MWLNIDQIVQLGMTKRWVEKKLASGEWQSRDSGRRGRNGKAIREVELASLPEALQVKWAQQESGTDEVASDVESGEKRDADEQLDELMRALSRYGKDEREAFIAEVNRLDDIVRRYGAIKQKRMRDAEGKLVFVKEVEALCSEAVCSNELILAREPKRGKLPSPHTLDGWFQRRKSEGLTVFLRAQGKASASDNRCARVPVKAATWLNNHWRGFPNVAHLIERFKVVAAQNKWKIPSDSWFYRKYSNVPTVVKSIVFGTDKDYTSRWKPFVPRTVEDLDALQMLCGDHHILDVHCWSERLREIVRLWLTAWQDIRTGLIYGYHLDYTPSSYTIACAYGNGVRKFGAQPISRDGFTSYLYTDNGKDYKSRNLQGEIVVHKQAARIEGGLQLLLTQQGVGIANDADAKQFLARNFNGREKPIERTFKDVADAVQTEFYRTGWCGRSTKDRPDSWRELYARHQKAIKHNRPSPFPAELMIRDFVAETLDKYNTRSHTRSTLGGAKIVPLTEFNRLYTTRYEIKEQNLALLLMKSSEGTLRKNGVWCLGASYWHDAMTEFKGVKDATGKPLKLEVRYTDDDYSHAWVVLPNGTFCEASRIDASSIITPNKETHKAVAQMIKHERNVVNEFQLITQSRLRGESVEDRVVAALEIEQPEEMPLAVNAEGSAPQGRVQKLSRFDAKKLRAVPSSRGVSATDVSSVEADASIFEAPERGRVSEFDFED